MLFEDAKSKVYSMTNKEIYDSHPWFQNYPFEKFVSYVERIKSAATNLQKVVAQDEIDIWRELIAHPRGEVTVHGYPFWDTHSASALLEADIRNGIAEEDGMKPKQFWESRQEYWSFHWMFFVVIYIKNRENKEKNLVGY